MDDSSSSSSSSSPPSPAAIAENVNKKIKNKKNWTVYIVTSIVQTLEDVCVNIAKPQDEVTRLHSWMSYHHQKKNVLAELNQCINELTITKSYKIL